MILMILAVPVHIFAKKHKLLYILSYALNTVGSGFAVSAYYLEKQLTTVLGYVILISTHGKTS